MVLNSNDLAAIGWLHRKSVRDPMRPELHTRHIRDATNFPIFGTLARQELVKADICPECGGALDTGGECNECGFDTASI